MLNKDQIDKICEQINQSGFPLEHWTSSLLRAEGWSVSTNFYYIDSDDKKPREMDIVASLETHLKSFKVKTVLLISCKKSQNYFWGFLRRPFPMENNRRNLFPTMITSKVPSVNYSLRNWGWQSDYCKFLAKNGLAKWFDVPRHDVFAHQQIPTGNKGKLNDGDMHSATMQLIKSQAYEMAGHHKGNVREVVQFNLISITDGDFLALNFDEGDLFKIEEISEQVALTTYKIDNCDHDSRILYLTKKSFSDDVSLFKKLHKLNINFFSNEDVKFLDGAIFDAEKRSVYINDFTTRAERVVLQETRSYRTPPYTAPRIHISLFIEAPNVPVVKIAAKDPEILEAARTPRVREKLARDLAFFWGHEGDFDVQTSTKW
ncbi:hypothetical protein [Burkholderia gladioli]|uniref:hypothetical protein n=1 Tax=Burkholderia gladioli TaxID=28095 RepID=UPI00163E94A3|nr:hypothetical protein [Burkholderia gladioli]